VIPGCLGNHKLGGNFKITDFEIISLKVYFLRRKVNKKGCLFVTLRAGSVPAKGYVRAVIVFQSPATVRLIASPENGGSFMDTNFFYAGLSLHIVLP
jgi:hypothetical protein